jgi:hypothetical protein
MLRMQKEDRVTVGTWGKSGGIAESSGRGRSRLWGGGGVGNLLSFPGPTLGCVNNSFVSNKIDSSINKA